MSGKKVQKAHVQKGATIFLPLTLPNDDRFSEFFHRLT